MCDRVTYEIWTETHPRYFQFANIKLTRDDMVFTMICECIQTVVIKRQSVIRRFTRDKQVAKVIAFQDIL